MTTASLTDRMIIGVFRLGAHLVWRRTAKKKAHIPIDSETHAYGSHRQERLDLLKPSTPATGKPLVIYLHGGGWFSGSKDWYNADLQFLCHAGYEVFNLDYPLAPETRHPAIAQSVYRALTWIKNRRPDAARIHLMGDSSGGNLAGLIGLALANPDTPFSGTVRQGADICFDVASLVAFYGVMERGDMIRNTDQKGTWVPKLMFTSYAGPNALHPEVDPSQPITPMDMEWESHPPCFQAVGTKDFLIQSVKNYHAHIDAKGATAEMKIYEDANHGFLNNQDRPQTAELKKDVLAFLERHSA